MNEHKSSKRITVPVILERKRSEHKISCLTAYDVTFARLIDAAGVDLILVGDSLGTVVQGHETTLPVTLDEIIYHTQCVSRGVSRALLVADMPFLSYQSSIEQAINSAGRVLKESGAAAVKLEGGIHLAATIERLVQLDIPVMGHVGLTPQSYHRMGGYKIQGKKDGGAVGERERVLEDALAVERAGAFAVVIEGVPAELAAEITEAISIPTIGIGAGPHCDGQILVMHDLLGLNPGFSPRFVKQYASLAQPVIEAVRMYIAEVEGGSFPDVQHSFSSGSALNPPKLAMGLRRGPRRTHLRRV